RSTPTRGGSAASCARRRATSRARSTISRFRTRRAPTTRSPRRSPASSSRRPTRPARSRRSCNASPPIRRTSMRAARSPTRARAGKLDEAKKEIEALVAVAPNDPSVYDFAGDVVLEAAPLDAARYYVRAVRIAPDNVEYRLKLGSALVRAGQYAAALEHLHFA